jgi:hypothetical protein
MRTHLPLLCLLALPSFGCGDPAAPEANNLRVSVSTTGVDRDNGYTIRADDGPSRAVQTVLWLFLPPGEHDVVLEGIAPNCSVEGADSVRVTVVGSGEVASTAFQVACRAVTGAIEVVVPTSGRDFDPDGYTVRLDDAAAAQVFPGGSVVVEGVSPGSHLVTLDDISANCRLTGPPNQTVRVSAGGLTRDTVRARFDGSCQAVTGDVQLFTTTEGVDLDPNGYTVTVDGELVIGTCGYWDYGCEPGAPLTLAPNGNHFFPQVAAGDHTYQLGDIASNCTVAGGDTRTVSTIVGETVAVLFDVSCERS